MALLSQLDVGSGSDTLTPNASALPRSAANQTAIPGACTGPGCEGSNNDSTTWTTRAEFGAAYGSVMANNSETPKILFNATASEYFIDGQIRGQDRSISKGIESMLKDDIITHAISNASLPNDRMDIHAYRSSDRISFLRKISQAGRCSSRPQTLKILPQYRKYPSFSWRSVVKSIDFDRRYSS
jgi:hypothetical protein